MYCTAYIVQCKSYIVHCTLFRVHHTEYRTRWYCQHCIFILILIWQEQYILIPHSLSCRVYMSSFHMHILQLASVHDLFYNIQNIIYVHLTHFGNNSVQCTLHSIILTLYSVPQTVYKVQSTWHGVNCTAFSVHCTVYRIKVKMCKLGWQVKPNYGRIGIQTDKLKLFSSLFLK